MAIKLHLEVLFGGDYDDGGGNSGDYSVVVEAFGALPDILIRENRWYRPKFFGFRPPSIERTVSMALVNTDAGAPPATVDVVIGVDGVLTPSSSYLTHLYVRMDLKIISIDYEAIHDDERAQLLVFTPPFCLSEHGRAIIRNGAATYLLGSSGFNDWANGIVMNDGDYELTAGFADVNDVVYVEYMWDMVNIDPSEAPNIQDCVIITADKVLLETDWHTGQLIEKSGQLLLNYLGITEGDYAVVIGTLLEYNKDGEFGDLDLPLEVFEQRLPST